VVEVLKVSSKSNPNSVAGALAGVLRQSGAVEVQVVGAGALNQAIKAIAIARGFVAPSNLDLVCIPTFADILIDGQARTAIRLAVEDRTRRRPTEAIDNVELPASAAAPVAAVAPVMVNSPATSAAIGSSDSVGAIAGSNTAAGTGAGLAADADAATTTTAGAFQASSSSEAILT
jgi:stage V sporulation protein S